MGKTLEQRFWEKVDIGKLDECWLWRGRTSTTGYGVLSAFGKNYKAHRLSFEFNRGEIPAGLFVLHNCDVRACVNPKHLRVGSLKDNSRDAIVRGRNAHGETSGRAVLTVDLVLEMRRLYKEGTPGTHIARQYGFNQRTVYHAIRGTSWKRLNRKPYEVAS